MEGDIYPDLLSPNADILAIPLTHIYNQVINKAIWKRETVITIPKKCHPDSLSQCRNLSCTPFFSKTLERFVFSRINHEIKLRPSQYGGRKGIGVDHMIVDMWETILSDLDKG